LLVVRHAPPIVPGSDGGGIGVGGMHTGEGTPETHVNPLLQVDMFSDNCLHGIPFDPGGDDFLEYLNIFI